MSRLHWIEIPAVGRIAISARPRADDWLETEVGEWKASGLNMVVSLLERGEISELGLQREAELCRRGLTVPDTDEQRDWIMAFGRAHQIP